MLRRVKAALVANLVLGSLVVFVNYLQWQFFAGNNVGHTVVIASSWNPVSILAVFHVLLEGNTYTTIEGIFQYFNWPFIMFWLLFIINLFFIPKIASEQKDKARSAIL